MVGRRLGGTLPREISDPFGQPRGSMVISRSTGQGHQAEVVSGPWKLPVPPAVWAREPPPPLPEEGLGRAWAALC